MWGFTREFALRADQLAVSMIKWLTNLFDGVRIGFAYFSYEEECRKQWVADANRTYSTAQVEQSIKDRMAEPLCHVSSTYDAPIRELESKRPAAMQSTPTTGPLKPCTTRAIRWSFSCAW
jgi:hypothetical protein